LPCSLQSRKNRTLQKPLRHRHFCAIKKISRASLRNRAVHVVAHSPAPLETQDVVSVRARWRFIVQKHWFFYRAVVIPMQCSRSPRALDDIATHSRLGGQHGEEAKEDGEGSEKGREEDQAPEEEVSARRASVFDFERRR
jgi:hypothetical protein